MKAGLACILLLACSAYAQNAYEPPSLAVQLFSTRPVNVVTLTPLSVGFLRPCARCAEIQLKAPVTFKRIHDGIQLSTSAKLTNKVSLRGAFRIGVDGQKQSETAAGQWTITPTNDGLRVLVATTTERYVMAALSGEAAPDEPLESLKAMAVAARTFAIVNQHRHAMEGFDLCDSTHCQALRFGAVRPEIEQAVRATVGETLWFGNHCASIYMTQDCGGETEDASSEWPAVHEPYLGSHADPYCLRRSQAKWHADIELPQLSRILHEEGWKTPAHVDSVQIIKRTATGRALLLQVRGRGESAQVSASSFRFAVNRALGWNQLRSDWYEITRNNNVLHFEGKGYGHGVGLCQAGAFEMAKEGHRYRDILSFYYPGTQVRITPSDSGWQQADGQGWTLMTASSMGILNAGNAAWAKAQSLFPPKSPVHPVVHLMPSTELFRQTTEEPGWMLASTRGTDVYLQPVAVLQAHGGASAVLLHEFLHVLIEQEATPKAPLWLREGLVETLADVLSQASTVPQSVEILEAHLAHPASMTESQRAHSAAGQKVRKLIQQYGLATVRDWLRKECQISLECSSCGCASSSP
jgi:stage II sporulation protein D